MDPVIELTGVGRSIGGAALLRDVSFTVGAAEALGVIGPSGSGKSTLLRLLAGLDEPTAGRIAIDGRVVSEPGRVRPPWERGIGMVFQQPSLWPHMTVAENAAFGLCGLPKREAAGRLEAVLALTYLEGLEGRRPHQLSGGEAQRAALARAIAPRPRILLLDEPLSSLDPDLHASMVELFRRVRAETGPTVVYVSHDHAEAAAVTDRVIRLRRGRVEYDGGWADPERPHAADHCAGGGER